MHAFGTTCDVRVVGGPSDLVSVAERRLRDLEARWTRFRPDSELSRLNAADGRPTRVSLVTAELVAMAVDAWFRTAGLFDPTVLPALLSAGYDRSFERLPLARSRVPRAAPAPGCAGIGVDVAGGVVSLPPGVQLDLGGIAKGFAADLVAKEALSEGARGVCVDLGGDVRLGGVDADGEPWVIAVDDPFEPGHVIARLALEEGAVVTSSTRHRRWMMGDGAHHHLIDPRSGASADTGISAATVLGSRAAWAEVAAKAAIVAGVVEAARIVSALGLTGLLVDDAGHLHRLNGLGAFAE
ncbi:MAG TPA: FAD:protein FMN transferase [Acidimicrobiales bacterium]